MAGPIIIIGPDGAENEFPEGTPDAAIKAAMAKTYGGPAATAPAVSPAASAAIPPQQQPAYKPIKELPGGVRLLEGPEGKQVLVGKGFATSDAKEIKRILRPYELAEKNRAEADSLKRNIIPAVKDADGTVRVRSNAGTILPRATVLEMKAKEQERIFERMVTRDTEKTMGADFARKDPIAAGAMQFLSGLPFVGAYVDEALGAVTGSPAMDQSGISPTDIARGALEGAREEKPVTSGVQQFAGGVTGLVGTPGLLPAATARGATSTAQITSGLVRGGGIAATEGAVSGYGLGEDGTRLETAAETAAVSGGLGLLFGPLSPAGERTWANLHRFALKASDKALAQELGTSPEIAGFLRQALQNEDFGQAQAALARAGDKGMLADATKKLGAYLDVAIQTGGAGGTAAQKTVAERVATSSQEFQTYMDASLGVPTGRGNVAAEIKDAAKPQMKSVYDAAYAKPIDYSGTGGQQIEVLLKRVPGSAITKAKQLMQVEGVESKQVLADVAADGTVTFRRMPDVREIDYIRRALNDVAQGSEGTGQLGGKTQYGAGLENLSMKLRDAVAESVPEYKTALKTAANTFDELNALKLGYDALSARTKAEDLTRRLAAMTPPERRAAKLGLRNAIEDTLADVKRTASNPDRDVAEFRTLLGKVSSRSFENKLEVILGDKAAKQFMAKLDEEIVSLELMAAVATNSKTQARQELAAGVRAVTAPGIFDAIQMGEPLRAQKMLVQAINGKTEAARQARDAGIFDELASTLVDRKGQDAKLALKIIEKAARGQAVSDRAAAFAARTILRPASVAGYQAGTQQLRYNPEKGEVE